MADQIYLAGIGQVLPNMLNFIDLKWWRNTQTPQPKSHYRNNSKINSDYLEVHYHSTLWNFLECVLQPEQRTVPSPFENLTYLAWRHSS